MTGLDISQFQHEEDLKKPSGFVQTNSSITKGFTMKKALIIIGSIIGSLTAIAAAIFGKLFWDEYQKQLYIAKGDKYEAEEGTKDALRSLIFTEMSDPR